MSNAVYPTLPGLSFGTQRTVLAPPVHVRTTPSQREFRARDATLPRYQYTLQYEFLRSRAALAELQTLVGFFNARGGSFESFRFLDIDDTTAGQQQFGTGNGTTTQWQLLRSMGGFAEAVSDLAAAPAVTINSVAGNLLANGGMELDSNSDGLPDAWALYTAGATGTVGKGLVNGPIYAGPTGKYVELSASALNGNVGLFQGVPSITGSTYTLSADLVVPAGCTAVLEIDFTAQGAYVSGNATSVNPGGGRRSVSAVAPTGADSVACFMYLSSNAGVSRLFNIDEAQLSVGTSTTFCATSYSVGPTGLVTFSPAPPASSPLAWSGSFYRRVRFLRDQLDTTKFMQDLWEAKKVELLSIKAGGV